MPSLELDFEGGGEKGGPGMLSPPPECASNGANPQEEQGQELTLAVSFHQKIAPGKVGAPLTWVGLGCSAERKWARAHFPWCFLRFCT